MLDVQRHHCRKIPAARVGAPPVLPDHSLQDEPDGQRSRWPLGPLVVGTFHRSLSRSLLPLPVISSEAKISP
jgi:hypothetical protein